MKITYKKTAPVTRVVREINAGKYDFDHPVQRSAGQWNNLQKSELIESVVKDYPIPNVFVVEDTGRKKNIVIDGKQRLTTIYEFVNNEFRLHKSINPVVVEEKEYEMAGKLFKELDETIQTIINEYNINIGDITESSDDEIREAFRRLNNGKALTKSQKNNIYISEELGRGILDVLENSTYEFTTTEEVKKRGRKKAGEIAEVKEVKVDVNFFNDIANISNGQVRNGEDRDIVLQTMMLIDSDENFGFENSDIQNYIISLNAEHADELLKDVKNAATKLTARLVDNTGCVFKFKNLKKTSIAPVLCGMVYCVDKKLSTTKYAEKIAEIFQNVPEEYSQYCNTSGTARASLVQARKEYFLKIARSC